MHPPRGETPQDAARAPELGKELHLEHGAASREQGRLLVARNGEWDFVPNPRFQALLEVRSLRSDLRLCSLLGARQRLGPPFLLGTVDYVDGSLQAGHVRNFAGNQDTPTAALQFIDRAVNPAIRVRAGGEGPIHCGEEFAVLMPHASPEGAAVMAEEIRQRVAALDVPALEGHRITVSSGLAAWHAEDRVPEDWLAAADVAVYAAKKAGRNRVVMARSAATHLRLVEDNAA